MSDCSKYNNMVDPSAPLVSVIVPVFNGERFILAALNSIRNQSYRRIEIIVVDDGSCDGSYQLLENSRDVITIQTQRQGVAYARNTGLARASGELISFLDQDDLWTTDKLLDQVYAFQADPCLGFNFVLQTFFMDDGPRPTWLRDDIPQDPHPSFVPSSMMARRSVFDVVGNFNPTLRFGSDTDWIQRAKEKSVPYRVIKKLGLLKRLHPDNESGKAKAALADLRTLLRASIERRRHPGDQ